MNVIYGSAGGLSASGDQLWSQKSPGISGVVQIHDRFGESLAAGDFNYDGNDDLAVGVPDEDVGSSFHAGGVNVIYGSPGGLAASGNQLWTGNSPGIACGLAYSRFGSSLTSASFDGDRPDDLAVGMPSVNPHGNAGVACLIYGSANGLSEIGNQVWHQDSPGILDEAEFVDGGGEIEPLTAGDFGGPMGQGLSPRDLVIGIPDEGLNEGEANFTPYAGAATVIYGSAGGLSEIGNQFWHQDSPGIAGEAEAGDEFGGALPSVGP